MDIVEPNQKIDIEYDGKHWHDIEKDKIRDNFLESKGWKIIRISSECLNRNNNADFVKIVDSIIEKLK